MAPGDDAADLDRIATTEGSSDFRFRRKDGTEFWAALFVSPVQDEKGDVVQHFASFVDLTRQRDEQAKAKMLIDELNHRVKNTLATVQSITSQALRNSSSLGEVREAIESRLFALSRSHELLTRKKWASAGLRDIVDVALQPFGIADGRSERFTIQGENVRFPPNATTALGMALHELATNAVKYGAFSNASGSILVRWATEATSRGDRLVLLWQEKDGPPVTPPTRKGFGSRVIERGLAHELDGVVRLDYLEEGVRCTIDVPAPAGDVDG